MRTRFGAFGIVCLTGLPVWAEEPLSAIDWLSDSVAAPAGTTIGADGQVITEPGVTKTSVPSVVSTVLGAPTLDTAGVPGYFGSWAVLMALVFISLAVIHRHVPRSSVVVAGH